MICCFFYLICLKLFNCYPMKKLLYYCTVLVLVFSSCSSNSEEEQNVPAGFLKRVDVSGLIGTVDYNYFYDGNKISKVLSKHGTKRYIYTGNLITEIRVFNSNSNLLSKKIFQYNANDELISSVSLYYDNNYGYRQELVYNTDGTVLVKYYTGNLISQNNFDYSVLNYFEDNEIIKTEVSYSLGLSTVIYEYDSGNNPMRQVIGYNKLNILEDYGDCLYFILHNGNQHNCIKRMKEGENADCNIIDYNVVYNSANYPILYCPNEQITSCSDLPCYEFIYQ